MKKTGRIELILNSFGWKTVSGRVEYKGFEHLLNPDMPNWRTEIEEEEEVSILEAVEVTSSPKKRVISLEVNPVVAETQKKNQQAHLDLVAAQQRVDALKLKAKEKAVK